MPKGIYAQISTSLPYDPKIARCSVEAELLYIRCVLFARQQLSDGVVYAHDMPIVGVRLARRARAMRELCASGLLVECAEGWRFPAEVWEAWNPSAQEVATKRDGNAARQAAFRQRRNALRARGRDAQTETETETEEETEEKTTTTTDVVVARQVSDLSVVVVDWLARTELKNNERRGVAIASPARWLRATRAGIARERAEEISAALARHHGDARAATEQLASGDHWTLLCQLAREAGLLHDEEQAQ